MEVIGAIGTIHTMYSLIKTIVQLQETVVKHKEEAEAFAKFVAKIEEKLKTQESHFQQHGREQTLPSDIAYSLGELLKLLEASKHLLDKLQSYLTITRASRRIKELREKINGVRLDIAFDMHFAHEQRVPQHTQHHPQRQGPSVPPPSYSTQPARRSEFPSFSTSGTPSYYPPEHAGMGWKDYRERIYPGHVHSPDVGGRNPDRNRFHPSPHYLSPSPTQGPSQLWRIYQRRWPFQFPGAK